MRPFLRAIVIAALAVSLVVTTAGCEFLDTLDPVAPDPDVPGKASPSLEIPPPR